jgi:hypothetical protein
MVISRGGSREYLVFCHASGCGWVEIHHAMGLDETTVRIPRRVCHTIRHQKKNALPQFRWACNRCAGCREWRNTSASAEKAEDLVWFARNLSFAASRTGGVVAIFDIPAEAWDSQRRSLFNHARRSDWAAYSRIKLRNGMVRVFTTIYTAHMEAKYPSGSGSSAVGGTATMLVEGQGPIELREGLAPLLKEALDEASDDGRTRRSLLYHRGSAIDWEVALLWVIDTEEARLVRISALVELTVATPGSRHPNLRGNPGHPTECHSSLGDLATGGRGYFVVSRPERCYVVRPLSFLPKCRSAHQWPRHG